MLPDRRAVASKATLDALELPALLAMVGSEAATDLGRDRVLGLRPLADAGRLEDRRNRFREAARLVADGALVPSFEESLRDLRSRLQSEQSELDGRALVTLARAVGVAAEAGARAAAEPECESLAALARKLPDLDPWRRQVERALDDRGRVRDDASPRLRSLRRRVQQVRQRLYGGLKQTVAEQRELLSEDTIPLQDGRLVLLLQAGARGRMPGLVHGRSASGRSLYFEPLSAVEDNNRFQEAVAAEEIERQRILNDLVTEARARAPAFADLLRFVAEVDSLQAAARFAVAVEGRLAEITEDHKLRLARVHHPLLDPRLARLRLSGLGEEGHTATSVPIDLDLSPARRVAVVTGPNAGGKTVTLKTLGLTVLATQCGLPVPAAAGTRLPRFDRVTAAVGDEQDLLQDRSTFSGRLLRLREAWEAAGPRSLVLVDELGSGTDPEEGTALAVALLEALLEEGGFALLTTHLTPLAAAALQRDGAWCAAMEIDPATGEPSFRVRPGAPGGSDALALARRLGLPAAWLDRAEALLGGEHRDLRRLLAEVESVRGRLAEAEVHARREVELLGEERAALEHERSELLAERTTLGRRLRGELEAFRRKVTRQLRGELETLRQQVAAGRRRGLVKAATDRLFADAPLDDERPTEAARPLRIGDHVRHRGLGWRGMVRKLAGGEAEVTAGGKRLRCPAAELELTADGTGPRKPSSRGQVQAPDRDPPPLELKLIGQRVEPALAELDRFLDRALLGSLAEVRVVHGHGSGRLRQAVRAHLRDHPAVGSFRPGRGDEGGDGATVVTLAE